MQVVSAELGASRIFSKTGRCPYFPPIFLSYFLYFLYFLLTGYYKLYAFRKSIRVVCLIIDDEVVVKDVGRREDFEVYAEVARRLLKK